MLHIQYIFIKKCCFCATLYLVNTIKHSRQSCSSLGFRNSLDREEYPSPLASRWYAVSLADCQSPRAWRAKNYKLYINNLWVDCRQWMLYSSGQSCDKYLAPCPHGLPRVTGTCPCLPASLRPTCSPDCLKNRVLQSI